MGEKRGGPMGVRTKEQPSVRLDPPKVDPVLGEEGEEHAARLMKSAQSAQSVVAPQDGRSPNQIQEDEEKKEGEAENIVAELRRKEDEKFMSKYTLNISEFLVTGRLTHTFKIGGVCEVEIQTLIEDENLAIEAEFSGMINQEQSFATSHVSATIRRHTLARSIKSMNGVEYGANVEARFEKLGSMGSPMVLYIHGEYRKLNKAVSILLTGSSGNSLERQLIGLEPL